MKSIKILLAIVILFNVCTVNGQTNNALEKILSNYINVKDALVKSDASAASIAAKDLLNAIESVDKQAMNSTTHSQWMQSLKELKEDAEHINESNDISHQRDHFTSLSTNIYALFKAAKIGTTVYYQYCPMANKGKGGNWLSLENKIQNPYYGNRMLSCGRVLETIQ